MGSEFEPVNDACCRRVTLLFFSNSREVGRFGCGRGFHSKGLNSVFGEIRRVQEDKER
jgi:hypothetical protein